MNLIKLKSDITRPYLTFLYKHYQKIAQFSMVFYRVIMITLPCKLHRLVFACIKAIFYMIVVNLANIKKTATQVYRFFSHKNKVYRQRKINKK
jgi:hypothetical protein